MEKTLYDHKGDAISYIDENGIIYLFDGKSVGYIEDDTVYSNTGHHLGWFEEGWIRDHRGKRVFYTKSAAGTGPIPPARHTAPLKAVKKAFKIKGVQYRKIIKSTQSSSWSAYSGEMFFHQ